MRDAPSRLERARRRAHGAKRALAIASAVAFLAGLALVRVSHPGKAAAKTSSAVGASSSSATGTDRGTLSLGTASIAAGSRKTSQTQTTPQTQPEVPVQVQTHVS